jgi:MFS superfamily sulfate permease-like transporter
MKKFYAHLGDNLSASIVVLLVALPLCVGIALASGTPIFSGIIAGIIGGIVVGQLSGSQLSVSGPAASLTFVVSAMILKLGSFETFLLAVLIAGAFQILFGLLKGGIIGDYIPNAVIKGMVAAIGIILMLKQIPHLLGYDADFEGDESFLQDDRNNTLTTILTALKFLTPTAVLIGIISIILLMLWELGNHKRNKWIHYVPGPLIVVVVAIMLNSYGAEVLQMLPLEQKHLVWLPVANNVHEFLSFFTFPNFHQIGNHEVWLAGFLLAVIASLETLLGIEAVDKLDPLKRVTPSNKELNAQGIGNIISGLIGGLPITSVIVRSSANVNAGGKTKQSAIFHGVLILICVVCIPFVINKIPLSAIAAILIVTGYKIARVTLFREMFKRGLNQFIPFCITIIAILFSNLLYGIAIGIIVSIIFIIRGNFKSAILMIQDNNQYLIRFRKDITFLNKAIIKQKLESLPNNSYLLIDVKKADFIDKDVIDEINDFLCHVHLKNISVTFSLHEYNPNHLLLNFTKK